MQTLACEAQNYIGKIVAENRAEIERCLRLINGDERAQGTPDAKWLEVFR